MTAETFGKQALHRDRAHDVLGQWPFLEHVIEFWMRRNYPKRNHILICQKLLAINAFSIDHDTIQGTLICECEQTILLTQHGMTPGQHHWRTLGIQLEVTGIDAANQHVVLDMYQSGLITRDALFMSSQVRIAATRPIPYRFYFFRDLELRCHRLRRLEVHQWCCRCYGLLTREILGTRPWLLLWSWGWRHCARFLLLWKRRWRHERNIIASSLLPGLDFFLRYAQ